MYRCQGVNTDSWMWQSWTYLMLIRYWARATDSAFPVMVMVRSRLAGASRSSQLEIRIMAPESCLQRSHWNTTLWGEVVVGGGLHLISATLDPPFPMMQPMSSLGTVISWVCCWAAWFRAWPVRRARAETEIVRFRNFLHFRPLPVCQPRQVQYGKFHTFPLAFF